MKQTAATPSLINLPTGDSGLKIHVRGIVQGVGFRPFVYNLAQQLKLTGSVTNTCNGVEIFLFGKEQQINNFIDTINKKPPPLAKITGFVTSNISSGDRPKDFTIIATDSNKTATTFISPDIATCDDCVRDIFSENNRRFHYPFTNCTNCGPRMTIIKRIPYDRKYTAMADFPMCRDCEREYNDPSNRRFHAQPNACPKCGPSLSWTDNRGTLLSQNSEQCLQQCATALSAGKIVAIKGLGGFHLSVDADSEEAVTRLRRKKHRYGKPLAVMVANVKAAIEVGQFNDCELKLLTSMERPIVLVFKKSVSLLAETVSPNLKEIGIMLPYTPLHHILFAMENCPQALVMTSANLSGEPLCTDNQNAFDKLTDIADFFLVHNRNIVTRVDDSVVRIINNHPQMIRRSRGFAPVPIAVTGTTGSFIACGAELKNCFCLSRDENFFLSQHIGDLKGPDNLAFFEESIDYMEKTLQIKAEKSCSDQHPDYLSSRYCTGLELANTSVQHHHAHGAAIMAEHGLKSGIGVIFDGAGFGDDNTVWGGEFLFINEQGYERLGHLAPLPLPGGDRAAVEIWRMALSLLVSAGIDIEKPHNLPPSLTAIPPHTITGIRGMMEKSINTPVSSSIGRLFDAVASLLGIRQEVQFEGQAAMEMESLAWDGWQKQQLPPPECYTATITPSRSRNKDSSMLIDHSPLVHWLIRDMASGSSPAELALWFHLWLVSSTLAMIKHIKISFPETPILLGGGCFQNKMLMEFLGDRLDEVKIQVYSGETVPVNDGGIALGQAFVLAKTKD